MFDKILVPVDLTDKNRHAVEVARDLARMSGADVSLLHVIEPLDLPFQELEEFYERLEGRAARTMGELADSFREAGMEITEHVVYGDRAREIVAHAREGDFDLVVMTSRPLDPDDPDLAPTSWPTISHKVAIMSESPVLLVR